MTQNDCNHKRYKLNCNVKLLNLSKAFLQSCSERAAGSLWTCMHGAECWAGPSECWNVAINSVFIFCWHVDPVGIVLSCGWSRLFCTNIYHLQGIPFLSTPFICVFECFTTSQCLYICKLEQKHDQQKYLTITVHVGAQYRSDEKTEDAKHLRFFHMLMNISFAGHTYWGFYYWVLSLSENVCKMSPQYSFLKQILAYSTFQNAVEKSVKHVVTNKFTSCTYTFKTTNEVRCSLLKCQVQ